MDAVATLEQLEMQVEMQTWGLCVFLSKVNKKRSSKQKQVQFHVKVNSEITLHTRLLAAWHSLALVALCVNHVCLEAAVF